MCRACGENPRADDSRYCAACIRTGRAELDAFMSAGLDDVIKRNRAIVMDNVRAAKDLQNPALAEHRDRYHDPAKELEIRSFMDAFDGLWLFNISKGHHTTRNKAKRGEQCADCGHVTLEHGAAGCCKETVPCQVVVCGRCDTLHEVSGAMGHFITCYGGMNG